MISSTFDHFVFPTLDWLGSGDKHDRHDPFGFSVQNIVSPVYLCVRAYANVFLKYVKIETKNDHNKL